MKEEKKAEYTAKHIEVLEGTAAVRRRPGMYIGDTGKRGLHHLVFEILDNAVDEALMGYAKNIEVEIKNDEKGENVITVRDDGRGIPTDIHPKTKKSGVETAATVLHAGGKFSGKVYKASGGLHGVGLSVVNALSEWMEIKVFRNGKIYRQKYERGKPITSLEVIGETKRTGTEVTFKPDKEIFKEIKIERKIIEERLLELSYLVKGVRFVLRDFRENYEKEFKNDKGIVTMLKRRVEGIFEPIYMQKKEEDLEAEIAFTYTKEPKEKIWSFVNTVKTSEGGTHVTGFKSALTKLLNNIYEGKERITGDDISEGLAAVINVRIHDPQFEGQTKTKLGNQEVRGKIESFVYEFLKYYLHENPKLRKTILDRVLTNLRARIAAEKAKATVRRRSTIFDRSVLPGKLAECVVHGEKAELFIVEGESAGGSAKQARDKKFQAILPLKGKILNVEKARERKILENEEIKAIITAIGAGILDQFDESKLRYGKVIIMTDADVDGAHIRTLLLTFFYRYMPKLILSGRLYAAVPPLYKVKKGKKQKYVYSDKELEELRKEWGEDIEVQRFKGLGEMNPEQLWETTMNPKTRKLKKITIEDAEEAERLVEILMGKDVEKRREFIETYAKEVKNLDI